MEKDDKGSTLFRIGVSGCNFLLVPAYPGCPGSKAVKRSLLLLLLLPFWYRLTWIVPEKGPLCVCVCLAGMNRSDQDIFHLESDCKMYESLACVL